MTDRELMQMAMNALDNVYITSNETFHTQTVKTLRAALEQPEPEPVAYWIKYDEVFTIKDQESGRPLGKDWEPLYTASPNRKWVGLTDEERKDIFKVCAITDRGYVAAMVEAKLKEKNI